MSDTAPPSFPDRPAVQVEPARTPNNTQLLTLAVFVVIVAGLSLAQAVLIPVTIAMLLSFVLAPVMGLLRRIGCGRVPSVLLAVLFALGIILAIGSVIGSQVADLASDMPRYESTIRNKVAAVEHVTLDRFGEVIRRIGTQFPAASPSRQGNSSRSSAPAEPAPIPVEVHEPAPSPLDLAERIVRPVLAPLQSTFIVVVVTMFVLLQREDLRDRLIRLVGSRDLHRTTMAMDDAALRLSRYFLSQLGINAIFGCLISIGLAVIGVPSPVLWGIVAALMRFVPYVGVYIALVVPASLAAAVDPGWAMAAWTVGLFLVLEIVTGQLIEPWVYGHSTGLSPVAVVVAAVFWTWLWGAVGLILSTPLTLCLVVLGRHVGKLEFLDVLLGDRPPLTPVENFYQRMLAGDPDEAHDQAEHLLREIALSSYYDGVVVKGLELANNDLARGVLSPRQLEQVRGACIALVEDLEGRPDREPRARGNGQDFSPPDEAERALTRLKAPAHDAPPPEEWPESWSRNAPVLCVAGRAALDEPVAVILAQLLACHGLPARVVAHGDVGRERIAALDTAGIALVCLCSLETEPGRPWLRYLIRRLRPRMGPDARVLAALWQPGAGGREEAAAALGVDLLAGSLAEAVALAVDLCHEAGRAAESVA